MTFRILALDGGGIKGSFTSGVLTALEERTGKRLVDHFDMIAGTSTGGIIALGIGMGMPAEEIQRFYTEHGPKIFPGTSLFSRIRGSLRHIFQAKHSQDELREALELVFGDLRLGDSLRPMVIPTYDAIGGRIFVLKTAHHEHLAGDYEANVVDVALATSAAPTYFSSTPFPQHEGNSYVDGGVWANSPAMVALVEAVHFLKVPLEDIDILSVGTTFEPFNIAEKKSSGIAGWNRGLIEIMMTAQQEAANAQSMLLVDRRYHRINTVTPKGEFSLDDAQPEQIRRLIALGRGEALKRENLSVVEERFLNGEHAAPFKPVYSLNPSKDPGSKPD